MNSGLRRSSLLNGNVFALGGLGSGGLVFNLVACRAPVFVGAFLLAENTIG
jgi:hypothetical protein